MAKKDRKVVLVEWLDACNMGRGRWTDVDDVTEMRPLPVRSVGHVLREDEGSITIAAHVSGGNGVCENVQGEMLIPKSGIVKRRFLK